MFRLINYFLRLLPLNSRGFISKEGYERGVPSGYSQEEVKRIKRKLVKRKRGLFVQLCVLLITRLLRLVGRLGSRKPV